MIVYRLFHLKQELKQFVKTCPEFITETAGYDFNLSNIESNGLIFNKLGYKKDALLLKKLF